MKLLFISISLLLSLAANSQELYVFTDPASNLPAKSIGFRLTSNLMRIQSSGKYRVSNSPEVMVGLSRSLMFKADAAFSNMEGNFKLNAGSLYFKYRFFSKDEVHNHFRMAAYMRGSISNLKVHQPAIDLLLMNSGVETGVIATQLQKRTAISISLSHLYAADNADGNKFYWGNGNRHALGYTLAAGRLMLPKNYTNYDQTNVNLMLEILGQTNLSSGKTFVDLAPSVQFIIKSRMRVDLGYRFGLLKELQRTSSDGALVRFEYNMFNAF